MAKRLNQFDATLRNVRAANSRITALARRVYRLERALAQLRQQKRGQ